MKGLNKKKDKTKATQPKICWKQNSAFLSFAKVKADEKLYNQWSSNFQTCGFPPNEA